MQIDVLYELDGFGITYELKDGFATVLCPFHADTNPSGSVSLEHGGFKCFSCDLTSDFVGFLSATLKKETNLIRTDLEERYGATNDKIVDVSLVETAYKNLETESYLRAQLKKRCITDDIIRERRLGAANGRVTIPIYNKHGYVVNIRKYRPGGEYKQKFTNQRGHGKPTRLYPIDQLKYEKIVLCGGEIKALAAIPSLNKCGIGAISATAGEGNWDKTLTLEFKNKTVYLAYDIDPAGIRGAERIAHQLYSITREVFILKLPLDIDKYPNGDVNDFLAEGGDLPVLVELTEQPWVPTHKKHLYNGDITTVHVSSVVNAEFTTKRVKTDCVIAAIGQQPYTVPKIVECSCGRDQEVCGICPVLHDEEGKQYELHSEDPAIMAMVDATEKNQLEALKKALDIPSRCTSCTFSALKFFHVEDIRISPRLEISSREIQREMIPAYILQHNILLNETYEILGRVHPHPRTQASTLLISESKVSQDALTQYENANPHELNVFKPKEWTVESISNKLNEIYTDFEANVTGIYGRQDMHFVIDLAYHSVLFLDAFTKPNQTSRKKGWAEVLIVGDSAQGKTEATVSLMRHYKLGEKIDCKNATVAGVLGGLQQLGSKKWFVSWGVIPTHDKRLVVLEELKGMQQDVFSKLTDMRSSGVAQIPKIEKRSTHARTRLIALSNPREGRTMGTYSHGVEAIKQLIPNPEDIRRFDVALIVSSDQVSQEQIHTYMIKSANVDHFYTSELCQRLILWAWTVDKIEFESEKFILEQAIELQKQFNDSIPLINRGSMHEKLARLAAALAARMYSTEDYKTLIVKNCHVEFIVKFLERIYKGSNFKYDRYSSLKVRSSELQDLKAVKDIVNKIPNARVFALNLASVSTFDLQDVKHWTNLDTDAADGIIGALMREGAIARVRNKQTYYLEHGFIRLLDYMRENREFLDPPEYAKEEF